MCRMPADWSREGRGMPPNVCGNPRQLCTGSETSRGHSPRLAKNRGAQIRTGDLSDPNGARYQAAPHPETGHRVASVGETLVEAVARRWELRLGDPYPPGAAGYVVRAELPD